MLQRKIGIPGVYLGVTGRGRKPLELENFLGGGGAQSPLAPLGPLFKKKKMNGYDIKAHILKMSFVVV